jgi:hypothetical protein
LFFFKNESSLVLSHDIYSFRVLLAGVYLFRVLVGDVFHQGLCPNFITKATKLQGSNIQESKKNLTAGSTKPKIEPNMKETTKRLAPGGTGTQGRPSCSNYNQNENSSSPQKGLPQQKEHT